MGNYNPRNIIFRQSVHDFPLTVSLGNKAPAWGLARWGDNSALRFVPPDDEGFTLRGDTRRLVYMGRRRSHRFTILSDGAFEYDVILEREPESNVIVLSMEGAESYDFYRQPDFIKDPLLAGSYAVYQKDTLIGEGTGKLCHIHRPEIIDARGRRCWGDLSVAGNCLCITIPEQWLGEAKYPVVVDPTIGTTTVGSQITGRDPNNKYYDRPWLDNEYAMNKYLVPQNGRGLCTAHVYTYNEDCEGEVTPCLYTSNNNMPHVKKSQNENVVDVYVWIGRYPPGWRSNTFELAGDIMAGEYVWFGFYHGWFTTRFDYGGECYKGWFDYGDFPDYDEAYAPPYMTITEYDTFCNIKWSWYFTYTAFTAQNYVRKITQGIKLSDKRTLTASYKRNTIQSIKASGGLKRFETFYRNCVMTAHSVMNVKRYPVFFRKAAEIIKTASEKSVSRSLLRKCVDNLTVNSAIKRIQSFTRIISESIKNTDSLFSPVVIVRGIADKTVVYEVTRHTAGYIKILETKAEIDGKNAHSADYRRLNTETIQAEGVLFRGLILLVRLFSPLVLRDYIFGQFLKAREELKLKSCISREIVLGSRIV